MLLATVVSFLAKQQPRPVAAAEPVVTQRMPLAKEPAQQPYLYTPSAPEVVVCSSMEAWTEFSHMAARHDTEGLRRMMEAGAAMEVDNYEQVLIIDLGTFTSEVRVLGGVHAGSSVFVAREFVRGLP